MQLAQRFKIPIRCVYFTAPAKLCEHNDAVRAIAGNRFNPENRVILPHTAFSSFASRFKQPQVDEGFQDVVPVQFQASQPDTRPSCKLIYLHSSRAMTSSARSGVVTGSRHRVRPRRFCITLRVRLQYPTRRGNGGRCRKQSIRGAEEVDHDIYPLDHDELFDRE